MITQLAPNEVFVFGSNLAGRHGLGAAKDALKWGAIMGVGVGRVGQTYAIPTKDGRLFRLPLPEIRLHVLDFLGHAKRHPADRFLVTPIGCGLAGYRPKDIAPFFDHRMANVILPDIFLDVLRHGIQAH